MATTAAPVSRRAAAVAIAALLAVAAPAPAATPDRPDLVIELPAKPYSGQLAPVYVDAYEQPGRLLYRFDAMIANQGGTLDLFRDPGDGGVRQAVWAGGVPSTTPQPDQPPQGPGAQITDRSSSGAGFEYAYEKTHEHWHFSSAARYELAPAGAAPRVSDKVGFCLFDSYGPATHFPYARQGAAGQTWCGFNAPGQAMVRMGLSPGARDRYASQREFQWVDVTGVEAGPATLRGQANPSLCILEADVANNVTEQARVVPGVRAAPAQGATAPGRPLTLTLEGEVVAPEVPARRSGACEPSAGSPGCYVFASAGGPLAFRVTDPPEHGTLALDASGAEARATYTPAPGFTGEDSFAYTATDVRGLSSAPATARVAVGAAPAALGTVSAPPVAARARLRGLRAARRGARWRLTFRASAPATLSGRLERRGPRSRVRRLRARRIRAGAGRLALGRLSAGRYRVRLRLDGRPAGSLAFRVRR